MVAILPIFDTIASGIGFMKLFKEKCIVCDKKLDKNIIEKHDYKFCSDECVIKFEENIKELEGLSLDDCC